MLDPGIPAAPVPLMDLLSRSAIRPKTRLAIFRPDQGRTYPSGDRLLYRETIRQTHVRFYSRPLAHQSWVQRFSESHSECKHGRSCRRPDSCTLGRRLTQFCVITGTLLPIWQQLQKALMARWMESETIKKAIASHKRKQDANDKASGLDKALNPKNLPKPPLRVIHLVIDEKPMLGLCLPHGVADKTIDTLLKKIPLERARAAGGGGGGGGGAGAGAGAGEDEDEDNEDDGMEGADRAQAAWVKGRKNDAAMRKAERQRLFDETMARARAQQAIRVKEAVDAHVKAVEKAREDRATAIAAQARSAGTVPTAANAPSPVVRAAPKPAAAPAVVGNGKSCCICFKTPAHPCSGCMARPIYYCSRDCQIKNWSVHKLVCKK